MNLYRPNGYYENIFSIDWSYLKERGVNCILVDADNTLFSHGKASVDKRIFDFIRMIESFGFNIYLCSNAKLSRAQKIADSLKIDFIDSCRKPLPNRVEAFLREKNFDKRRIVIVGDQIFTDMLLAKNLGVLSILVRPLSLNEPSYIKMKRFLERIYFILAGINGFYKFE